MKVFVVATHYETPDSASTTTINGGFSSFESAQKFMRECFDHEKKHNFSEELEFNECEVIQTETFCSIYNTVTCDHYVSIKITECDVED